MSCNRYFLEAVFRGFAFDFLADALGPDLETEAFFFLPLDAPKAEAQFSEYFCEAPLRRSDITLIP